MITFKKWSPFIVASAILLAGCSQSSKEFTYEKADRDIDHVHGAGFINDHLYVATHTGIIKYDGHDWYASTGNKHDYMGFTLTKDGFYSSGHPEEGSGLKNPLGLIHSKDGGETLDKLAFYGESDFHYITAGYHSGALYVINQEPNSELDSGLYYSLDEGSKWHAGKFSGFETDAIGNMSAHPTKEGVVAASSKDGLYLSSDYGDHFELISDRSMVPAVTMLEESVLYAGLDDNGSHLYKQSLKQSNKAEIPIPDLGDNNPIMVIAADHENTNQIAVITYENDIYLTRNRGVDWSSLSQKGKVS